jgi:DNA-binding response OmpR family regulator
MAKHILIVDDDPLLRRSLGYNLEQVGYHVSAAATAEDALALVRLGLSAGAPPDLVLLDIGLPGIDGLEALRQLRQQLPVPVVYLTARRRELDQVVGLEAGADDYVTKPFDIDVLLSRIKAVLRRANAPPTPASVPSPLVVGDLAIDHASHRVTVRGQAVELSPREFDLLYVLALEAGRVVSVDQLLARVWGAEYAGEPQVVYVHVRWLREKIESDPHKPRYLTTVRGVGYKLSA